MSGTVTFSLGAQTPAVTRQRVQLVVAAGLLALTVAATVGVAVRLLGARSTGGWLVVGAVLALLLVGGAGRRSDPRTPGRRAGSSPQRRPWPGSAPPCCWGCWSSCWCSAGCRDADERTRRAPGGPGPCCGGALLRPAAAVRSRRRPGDRRPGCGARPEAVLEAFGDRGTRDVPLEELLRQLAESLRASLGAAQRRGVDRRQRRLQPAALGPAPGRRRPPHSAPRTPRAPARAGVAGEAWLRAVAAAAARGARRRPGAGRAGRLRQRPARCPRRGAAPGRASGSGPTTSARWARSAGGSGWSCTTGRSTQRCRRASTTCGAPTPSCGRRVCGWSRPPTPSAAASSATSTTVRSSTSPRSRSTSAWPASCWPTSRRTVPRSPSCSPR